MRASGTPTWASSASSLSSCLGAIALVEARRALEQVEDG